MAIYSVGSNVERDYLDLNAFMADLPSRLTQQEVAEMYNDSEFLSPVGVSISGVIATADNNIIIRPALGQAFNDTEQALRYNAVNGVGIRKSTNYGTVMTVSVNHTELRNLQIAGTGHNRTIGLAINSRANCIVDNCLVSSASNGAQYIQKSNATQLTNTVIIVNQGAIASAVGIRLSYATGGVHNCTVVSMAGNSLSFGIEKIGSAANNSLVKNTSIFGFRTAMETGAWGAGTDFNTTDNATLPTGNNNLTSLVTSEQFVNVSSMTLLDARLKEFSVINKSGTPDSTFTKNKDIFGNERSTISPSSSAYEFAAMTGVNIPVIINQLRTQGVG